MSIQSKNIIFATDYLYQASLLLEETHPEFSETLYKLSETLYNELPEAERKKVEMASLHIDIKKEEYDNRG